MSISARGPEQRRPKSKKTAILITLLLVLLMPAVCVSCSRTAQPVTTGQSLSYFDYFDTISTISSYAQDSRQHFEETSAGVAAILEKYHRLLDIYNEYPGMNNLCTVNRLAGGNPVPLDPLLIDFLEEAVRLYHLTGGEMNILLGPVTKLWHDCREKTLAGDENVSLPSMEELEDAALHTGIWLLEIDRQNLTARLSDPQARLDVGALGKGYTAEKIAQYLKENGGRGYAVNIGGNLRLVGTKATGDAWIAGIRDPFDLSDLFVRIGIADTSCVTSGNYERYFTLLGRSWHHIIDRDTLMPASWFASVSVITPDSGLADALSTALFCMSYEDGLETVRRIESETGVQIHVLWICEDGSSLCTEGFEKIIIDN